MSESQSCIYAMFGEAARRRRASETVQTLGFVQQGHVVSYITVEKWIFRFCDIVE